MTMPGRHKCLNRKARTSTGQVGPRSIPTWSPTSRRFASRTPSKAGRDRRPTTPKSSNFKPVDLIQLHAVDSSEGAGARLRPARGLPAWGMRPGQSRSPEALRCAPATRRQPPATASGRLGGEIAGVAAWLEPLLSGCPQGQCKQVERKECWCATVRTAMGYRAASLARAARPAVEARLRLGTCRMRACMGSIKFCGVKLDALTGERVGSGHGARESRGGPGVSSAAQGSTAGDQPDGLAPRPRVTPQNLMLPHQGNRAPGRGSDRRLNSPLPGMLSVLTVTDGRAIGLFDGIESLTEVMPDRVPHGRHRSGRIAAVVRVRRGGARHAGRPWP